MNITEAVTSRRTIREFLDKPVDKNALERVLETASRAPSGGNVQPWNAVVMTGEPLQKLFQAVQAKLAQGKDGQSPEYQIYPSGLPDPYNSRRTGVGEAMYGALDIPRDDKGARLMQMAKNFSGFGAPVQLFTYTPRYMGKPQWSDLGMWLQTIMLLLREEGLDSCPQEAWSMFGEPLREQLGIDDEHIIFCGMAIGYRDPDAPINTFPVPRAPVSENVKFDGF